MQNRLSIYLDWAILQDACDGSIQGTSSDKRDFSSYIFNLSKKHNICISNAHLWDLALGNSKNTTFSRAVWLESLSPLWVRSALEIERFELENLMLASAEKPLKSYSFFTNSFIEMVHHDCSSEQLPDLLRDLQRGTISEYVKQVMTGIASATEYDLQRTQKNSLEFCAVLVNDRQRAVETGLTRESLGKYYDKVMFQGLRDSILRTTKGTLSDKKLVSDITDLKISKNVHVFPYVHLRNQATRALAWRIKDGNVKSAKFNRKQRSTTIDLLHLVGAAYCDIFSCDTNTSKDLGDARVRLGRLKQIVNTSNLELVMKSIQSQIDCLSEPRTPER